VGDSHYVEKLPQGHASETVVFDIAHVATGDQFRSARPWWEGALRSRSGLRHVKGATVVFSYNQKERSEKSEPQAALTQVEILS
jgi:hypothetical protein